MIKIKLPLILEVRDYHEFGETVDLLYDLSYNNSKKIKYKELTQKQKDKLNLTDYYYHAIIYQGKLPKNIDKLEIIYLG